MAKVKDFYGYLNSIAPFETQEDWDNSGMLVGDMNAEHIISVFVFPDLNRIVEIARIFAVDGND